MHDDLDPDDLPDWWEKLGWDAWSDPGGPGPANEWLVPADNKWEWSPEHLLMGEYVGFELYLRLRDRLCTLELPHACHDILIKELIDHHDAAALDGHGACATLICTDAMNHDVVTDMHIVDSRECPPITAMDPGNY